jgi:hypothetical protein
VNQNRLTWARVIAIDMLMLFFSMSISLQGQLFSSIKEAYGLSLSQGGLLLSGVALLMLLPLAYLLHRRMRIPLADAPAHINQKILP